MRSLAPVVLTVALAGFGATACSSGPAPEQPSSMAAPPSPPPTSSSKPAVAGEPLNGTYAATTDNSKRTVNGLTTPTPNDTSTWTITSTCTDDTCTGQVTSDHGWNAPAELAHGRWTVKFDKPDAVQCPNGPSVPATVAYSFVARTLTGTAILASLMGACGPGQIVVSAPWALVKAP
jgi:hypothetical protein